MSLLLGNRRGNQAMQPVLSEPLRLSPHNEFYQTADNDFVYDMAGSFKDPSDLEEAVSDSVDIRMLERTRQDVEFYDGRHKPAEITGAIRLARHLGVAKSLQYTTEANMRSNPKLPQKYSLSGRLADLSINFRNNKPRETHVIADLNMLNGVHYWQVDNMLCEKQNKLSPFLGVTSGVAIFELDPDAPNPFNTYHPGTKSLKGDFRPLDIMLSSDPCTETAYVEELEYQREPGTNTLKRDKENGMPIPISRKTYALSHINTTQDRMHEKYDAIGKNGFNLIMSGLTTAIGSVFYRPEMKQDDGSGRHDALDTREGAKKARAAYDYFNATEIPKNAALQLELKELKRKVWNMRKEHDPMANQVETKAWARELAFRAHLDRGGKLDNIPEMRQRNIDEVAQGLSIDIHMQFLWAKARAYAKAAGAERVPNPLLWEAKLLTPYNTMFANLIATWKDPLLQEIWTKKGDLYRQCEEKNFRFLLEPTRPMFSYADIQTRNQLPPQENYAYVEGNTLPVPGARMGAFPEDVIMSPYNMDPKNENRMDGWIGIYDRPTRGADGKEKMSQIAVLDLGRAPANVVQAMHDYGYFSGKMPKDIKQRKTLGQLLRWRDPNPKLIHLSMDKIEGPQVETIIPNGYAVELTVPKVSEESEEPENTEATATVAPTKRVKARVYKLKDAVTVAKARGEYNGLGPVNQVALENKFTIENYWRDKDFAGNIIEETQIAVFGLVNRSPQGYAPPIPLDDETPYADIEVSQSIGTRRLGN